MVFSSVDIGPGIPTPHIEMGGEEKTGYMIRIINQKRTRIRLRS